MELNSNSSRLEGRARELYEELRVQNYRRTDRLFALLMVLQFLGAILVALIVSPRTWNGVESSVHVQVWAALMLGAKIGAPAVLAALVLPGSALTRYVMAIAQMLFSALVIHLFGGRIEAHFHIFGSLAFLAFYRDWRILIPATLVVGIDHLVRGYWWPVSVYGELSASAWRTLEHVGWVLFEDVFLIASCIAASRDMKSVSRERARLEGVNAEIEAQVRERTLELSQKTAALQLEIGERKRAEAERESMHKQLADASWHAGMAEVATGVLHNVGNVLNSVNVSTTVIADTVRRSQSKNVAEVARLIEGREADLGAFLSEDPKGRLIPRYMSSLAQGLANEQRLLLGELKSLSESLEHMKSVVSTQQAFARNTGPLETPIEPAELVNQALRLNLMALERHRVFVVREFAETPPVLLDRQRVLQILVNLIANAKQALATANVESKQITVRTACASNTVRFEVRDNGVGIPPENLTRIFAYGFTTRKDGHGFGLHSAALTARAMGGSLIANSDGLGRGACFILELPLRREATV